MTIWQKARLGWVVASLVLSITMMYRVGEAKVIFSENPLAVTLHHVNFQKVSIAAVLSVMLEQGVHMAWTSMAELSLKSTITLSAEAITVKDFFEVMCRDKNYTYLVNENLIEVVPPLCLSLTSDDPMCARLSTALTLTNVSANEAFNAVVQSAKAPVVQWGYNSKLKESIPRFVVPKGLTVRKALNQIVKQFGLAGWTAGVGRPQKTFDGRLLRSAIIFFSAVP